MKKALMMLSVLQIFLICFVLYITIQKISILAFWAINSPDKLPQLIANEALITSITVGVCILPSFLKSIIKSQS